MRLRSIPPANRQIACLSRLSSMRAATRVGLIFVGASSPALSEAAGRPAKVQEEDGFRPRVIRPDDQRERQRQAFLKALDAKLRQLERLMAEAVNAAEMAFWRAEIERFQGGG